MQSEHTAITPQAHGIMDESMQDTLHVHWIPTRECDCRCTYCKQWTPTTDAVCTKDQLLSIAHTLFSAHRSYYNFLFTGGEPTLHPQLQDLVTYLYATEVPLGITIETNGQRPLEYYKQILDVARPDTLQLVITAHMPHVDLAHLCLLVGTVVESHQIPVVRLVFDPDHKNKFRLFHNALTKLRHTVPFTLHIWPLLHEGKADSRYTSEDYALWEMADQTFAAAASSLPASASLPVFSPLCRHKDQNGDSIESHADSMEADVHVSGLHCCMGINLLCVEPDGSYMPGLCSQATRENPLWNGNRHTVNSAGRICVCTSELCSHAENDVIPKFRELAEAEECLKKSRERGLAALAKNIPLPHPVRMEPDTDEIIRVRLKRLKPLRTTTAAIPSEPELFLQHAAAIRTLYEALHEESRELFLRTLNALKTGNCGYLPIESLHDTEDSNSEFILLNPGTAEYLTKALHYMSEHPGITLSLSCPDGDTAILLLRPLGDQSSQEDAPAPLWPAKVFPDRISIIIPAHDNESTIRRSLDSALVQDVENLEIIVVDSDSHDGTSKIIEEYSRRHPEEIRVIRLPVNRGPGLARNAGLDIATGAYISFLDSDDVMNEHFLRCARENMRTAQADIAVFSMRIVHENGRTTILKVAPGVYSGEKALELLLTGEMGGDSINNRLYTTSLLRENSIRFSEIVVHHDLLFNIDATWNAACVCTVDTVGYTQYIRKNAVGNRNNRNAQIDAFSTAVQRVQAFFENNNLDTSSKMFTQCLDRMYTFNRPYMLQTIDKASDSDLATALPDVVLRRFSASQQAVHLLLMDTVPAFSKTNAVLLPDEREAFLRGEAYITPDVPACTPLGQAETPPQTVPLLSLVVTHTGQDWDLELCLERLTFQDLSRAEVIAVCPGGATCLTELEDLAEAFPQCRLYHAPEGTPLAVCRRIAVEKAASAHVCLLETTDIVSAGFVSAACELIESRQPDVLLFSVDSKPGAATTAHRHLGDGTWSGLEAVRHAIAEPALRQIRGTVLRVTPLRNIDWQHDDAFYYEAMCLYLFGISALVLSCARKALSIAGPDQEQGETLATRGSIQAAWGGYALLQRLAEHHSALSTELEIICRNHMLSTLLPQYAAYWQATDTLPLLDGSLNEALPVLSLRALWKLRSSVQTQETALPEPDAMLIAAFESSSSPVVSIIVPLREHSEDFTRLVESLQAQSMTALEIIILDNTSGDAAAAHLRLTTAQDTRFKIISVADHPDDVTLCERGLNAVTGQFVLFMEPGDTIHADAVLRGAGILRRLQRIDAVWLDSTDAELGEISLTPQDVLLEHMTQEDVHRAWLTTGTLFRRQLFTNGFRLWTTLDAGNVYLWAVYTRSQGVAQLALPATRKQYMEKPQLLDAAQFAALLNVSLCHSENTPQDSAVNIHFMQRQLLPRLKMWLATQPRDRENGMVAFTEEDLSALAKANIMSRLMLDDCASLYYWRNPSTLFAHADPLHEGAKASPFLPCGTESQMPAIKANITVILIVCDAESTLGACLDRLVEQKGDMTFEILLIDNASKDGTLDVCRKYVNNYTCIRMFRTLWKTADADLRNSAVKEVRGERFVFMHPGIHLAPYALSRMFEKLDVGHDNTTSLVFNHTGNPFTKLNTDDNVFSADIGNCILHPYDSQIVWNRVINTELWRKHAFVFMSNGEADPAVAMQLCLRGRNIWTSSLLTEELSCDYVEQSVSPEQQLSMSILSLCNITDSVDSIADSEMRKDALKLAQSYFNIGLNAAVLSALHKVKKAEHSFGLTEDQFIELSKHNLALRVLFSCYAEMVKGTPTPPTGSPLDGTKRRTARPALPQPAQVTRQQLSQTTPNFAAASQESYLPVELTAEEQELAKTDPKLAEVKALTRTGAFNGEEYLRMYPDVARAGMDPVMHYVFYGRGEGRKAELAKRELPYPGQPKVSVIVPVYNNAQYLHECIDSIINQTLKEIEIIIVNDGSTDPKAVEILNDYAAKDARINLIHKKNTGYGHTMNVGIAAARGEYIGIVESDDYILPEMYFKLYLVAVQKKFNIIKSNFARFYGDKCNREIKNVKIFTNINFYNREINPQLETDIFYMYNTNWNGIFNRELILNNGLKFNETPGAAFQDNGFWFLTLANATSVFCISNFLYCLRRDNPDSSINSKEKIFCMCDEYDYIEKNIDLNKHRMNKFRKMFVFKKYHNYNFTLSRIDQKYKAIFLERFSAEMRAASQAGFIDKEIFSKKDWENLQYIINFKIASAHTSSDDAVHEKNKNVKISIIIPIYNTAQYLHQCLNSVAQQTLKEIEIICVNDGSTDGSLPILEEFSKTDSRVIIINQINQGGGAARNTGLRVARGKYVMFLDSDDYYEPDSAEQAYAKCEKVNADIGIFQVCEFNENSNTKKFASWAFKKEYIPKQKVFNSKDMRDTIFNTFLTWPWNKIFKTSFIKTNMIKFQEIRRTNDLYFVWKSLVLATNITVIEKILVNYRKGNPSSCQSTNDESPTDFWLASVEFKHYLEQNDIYATLEKSYINAVISGALYNLRSLKTPKGKQRCYNVIKHEIFNELKISQRSPDFFHDTNLIFDIAIILTKEFKDFSSYEKLSAN